MNWRILVAMLLVAGTAQAQNLVVNGSFEEPALPLGTWAAFPNIPGWTGTDCGIEIQTSGVTTTAFDGRQLVELDSYCPSSMSQAVETVAGHVYQLSVAYEPRPGNPTASDDIGVYWNGEQLARLTRGATTWQVYSWTVTATGATSVIRFQDLSPSESPGGGYGGLLDDVQLVRVNEPPRCDQAAASTAELWPPNHALAPVSVVGVTDPEGTPVTIAILGVTQDEPTNGLGDGDTCADAALDEQGGLALRAERSGTGDGRVYRVSFQATDEGGATCTGTVEVAVPHSRKAKAVGGAQAFDSLLCE